ncbi:MAG: histidinol-phosphatase HisJ family protein [Bacteroidales bacterium]|nr:histidinol-phosphatase HisJ family protein [Bacteroidales bacterium]
MDFDKIISSTNNYNFHSHTQFCDGRAPMTVMAEAAVAAGMKHYGFTPHSPIPIPSPCNMKAEDVEEFITQGRRIASDPSLAACRFYIGMEVDYLSEEWGPAHSYFKNLPLDYTIGSVHFIPTQSGEPVDIDGHFDNFTRRMREYFRNDIDYVVQTYFDQNRAMIEAGGFDILGHFDKVGQNASYFAPGIEDGNHYQSLVNGLIDLIIERDITIELNTKARIQHGRFFPGERYLPRLVDAGVTILVNSDAHHPDRITASRAEALALLGKENA